MSENNRHKGKPFSPQNRTSVSNSRAASRNPNQTAYERLYQLIEKRLNDERNYKPRHIEKILQYKKFNDEQFINEIILNMLFKEKHPDIIQLKKMTPRQLKLFIENLPNDEQLNESVLNNKQLIEKELEDAFNYIPLNRKLSTRTIKFITPWDF